MPCIRDGWRMCDQMTGGDDGGGAIRSVPDFETGLEEKSYGKAKGCLKTRLGGSGFRANRCQKCEGAEPRVVKVPLPSRRYYTRLGHQTQSALEAFCGAAQCDAVERTRGQTGSAAQPTGPPALRRVSAKEIL